jgi:tRNA (uracil-5-)-methyltransferase
VAIFMLLTQTDPDKYQDHFENKVKKFQIALEAQGHLDSFTPLTAFPSPKQHYRHRTEFKCWHTDDTANYAMTDPDTKKTIIIDDFDIATKSINQLMPTLLHEINSKQILRKKCFQIEFLSTLSEEILVTLIYHKPLEDEWLDAIQEVKAKLDVDIIGRSRKQKLVVGRDYVNEVFTVDGRKFHYKQIEGCFSQPNGYICEQMLNWAVKNSQSFQGDLLELYCGNGNFTLPLAQNFNRVLATEISKTSVNAALDNIKTNDIDNVKLLRMSSEEFTQAMDKVRSFRRIRDAEVDLDNYQFSTVFVDPPRAGLDSDTEKMIQRFENIIYISCNPDTLIKNLNSLCNTHKIKCLAAFDQFPYTDHLETGVILSLK